MHGWTEKWLGGYHFGFSTGSHVRRKHKHRDVHVSDMSISTGPYTGANSVSILGISQSGTGCICLFVRWQKILPFLLCLCLRSCVPVHTYGAITTQAQAQEEGQSSFFSLVLASPRFTCSAFLCLYRREPAFSIKNSEEQTNSKT